MIDFSNASVFKLKKTIFIGCGSFLGGAARYLISVAMKTMSKGFPWGTLGHSS